MTDDLPNPVRSTWRSRLALFGLALVLRLVYFGELGGTLLFETLLGPDAFFVEQARALVASGDWSGPPHVFYHSPLYTYFLATVEALFGPSLTVVRMLQALLGSLACVMLADATERSTDDRRVGLLAGVLLALYPPALFFDGLIKKTSLALFFSTLFLALVVRAVQRGRSLTWIAAGLVLGLLAITRENARILLPLACVWGWIALPRARRVPALGAFVAAFVLVLLPVGLRNQAAGGELVFGTTNFGTNLWIGNNPQADGLCQPLLPGRGHTASDRVDALELAEAATGRELTATQVSDYWRGEALEFMSSEPLAWTRLILRKSYFLLHAREWIDVQSFEVFRDESKLLTVLGFVLRFGALVPLAWIGLVLGWRERRRFAFWYVALALLAASIALFFVFARFRMTLVPLLFFFAALAIARLPQAWRVATASARAFTIVTTIALTVALHWPVAVDEAPYATTWDKVGTALRLDGRYDEALACFERALERRPDYAPSHYNTGLVLFERGELAAGEAALQRAVQFDPSYARGALVDLARGCLRAGRLDDALRNAEAAVRAAPSGAEAWATLGLVQRRRGDAAAAEAAYRRALAIRPSYIDVHNNLGFLLAQTGRPSGAREHYEAVLELDPSYVRAWVNLADLIASDASVGSADEAVRAAERARKLAPADIQVHKVLAMAYDAAGRRADAIAAARRVIELAEAAGDTDQATRARAILNAVLAE